MSAIKLATASKSTQIHSAIGEIVDITDEGVALVDFPGNDAGPVVARSVLTGFDEAPMLPLKVTLLFENSDAALPVITGIVRDTLFSSNRGNDIAFQSDASPKHAKIDGKLITFDAKEEIQLNCGKSSIILKSNGKIVIKGAQVVSRSSGANKIKGSSVSIN